MTSKTYYTKGKFSAKPEKKPWVKPVITQIEQENIRQDEVELYYRLTEDPKIFLRIAGSGGGQG